MQNVAKVSVGLDTLTKQLNRSDVASGTDVGELKEKLSDEVAQKLL